MLKVWALFHAQRLLVHLNFLSRRPRSRSNELYARDVTRAKARSFAATICSGSSVFRSALASARRANGLASSRKIAGAAQRAPIGPRVASRVSECQSKRRGRLVDQSTSAALRSAEVLAADRKAEKGIPKALLDSDPHEAASSRRPQAKFSALTFWFYWSSVCSFIRSAFASVNLVGTFEQEYTRRRFFFFLSFLGCFYLSTVFVASGSLIFGSPFGEMEL